MKHDLQRPMRAALSAVLLALIALALAACGGSGGSGASTNGLAPRSGGFRGSTAFSQFAKCLSKHGVNLPAFSGGGSPPNGPPSGSPPSGGGFGRQQTPAERKAFQACSSRLPRGGGFGGGGAGPTGGLGPTNGAGPTGGTT